MSIDRTQKYTLDELKPAIDFRRYFVDRPECNARPNGKYDQVRCPQGCDANNDDPDNWHGCVYDDGFVCQKCRAQYSPYLWLTEVEERSRRDAFDILYQLANGGAVAVGAQKEKRRRRAEEVDAALAATLKEYGERAAQNMADTERAWWHGRGVSDIAIEQFGLGYYGHWYTMPTTVADGTVFAVKKRWDDHAPHPKGWRYISQQGSRPRFAPWVLKRSPFDDVTVIVGGEIKALALWSELQRRGIEWSVATTVGGEGVWEHEWNGRIKSPLVALWPDRDPPGTPTEDAAGARYVTRVRSSLGRARIVVPPPSGGKDAVDDFILAGGDAVALVKRTLNLP